MHFAIYHIAPTGLDLLGDVDSDQQDKKHHGYLENGQLYCSNRLKAPSYHENSKSKQNNFKPTGYCLSSDQSSLYPPTSVRSKYKTIDCRTLTDTC